MAEFGPVREMDFFVSGGNGANSFEKGNARVVFQHHDSAIAALDELHNNFFPNQNKRVFVTFASYNKSANYAKRVLQSKKKKEAGENKHGGGNSGTS